MLGRRPSNKAAAQPPRQWYNWHEVLLTKFTKPTSGRVTEELERPQGRESSEFTELFQGPKARRKSQ